MEKFLKQKKGITLIALVITIIVLLILAGISISMLSGDNSILQKAIEAKNKTDLSSKEEALYFAVSSSIERNNDNSSLINIEKLKENISDDNISVKKIGNKCRVEYNEKNVYFIYPNGKIRKKQENELEIDEIRSNASEYFSCDVINYNPSLNSLRLY